MNKVIDHLRNKLRSGRSELFCRVAWRSPACELLRAHASLIDELLEEIYEISCEEAGRKASPSRDSGLAIVATGGYGRKELHPFSDVDIAFIPSEEDDPWVEAVVHTAFKLVMDVFTASRELRVGYSFRPSSEAAIWDIRTKTALLDIRHVCGNKILCDVLKDRIRTVLSPLDIMLECRHIGGRTGRSLYSVEPNFKEGPGALRDLHRARWIFKLLNEGEDTDSGFCLESCTGASSRLVSAVREAADWFWRSRTWLHLAAGKANDTLMADYQDRIARELHGCSAQEWLSMHFGHSETLERFRRTAIRTLMRGPYDIHGTTLEEGVLKLTHPGPGSDVELFHASQRYSIPICLRDLDRLQDQRDEALKQEEPTKEEIRAFEGILGEQQHIAATLAGLAGHGLLDRFIPRFSETLRFAPPDPAHHYTVGEHALRMAAHLESLRSGEDPAESRFSDLLRQCLHFDMLCLACLIHDAGKILPGNDHSESSAGLAATVADRLGLAPEKRDILDILVRQHLLLVRTARLHDLKSPNVIQYVAERVPNTEALAHLYLFTYVDTCAVAKGNWTSMDVRDTEDLYRKIRDYHAESTSEDACAAAVEDRIVSIRKRLSALHPSDDEAVLSHCDAMPSSYVLNTPFEEIAFHLQLIRRLDAEGVVLDVYNRPGDDYSELTVCAYDDPEPGMLAKIAGVLFACGIEIHKAQAFTLQKARPVVLDTLWIRSNGMQISENRARRIRTALKDVLTGVQKLKQVIRAAGKSLSPGFVPDGIYLRNDLSEDHTVVHIIARDSHGLLYRMARSLSHCGLHIHSAKIATWSARAENNFYVTAGDGLRIPEADFVTWTEIITSALRL